MRLKMDGKGMLTCIRCYTSDAITQPCRFDGDLRPRDIGVRQSCIWRFVEQRHSHLPRGAVEWVERGNWSGRAAGVCGLSHGKLRSRDKTESCRLAEALA